MWWTSAAGLFLCRNITVLCPPQRLTAVSPLCAFRQMARGQPFCWVALSCLALLLGQHNPSHEQWDGNPVGLSFSHRLQRQQSEAQNWGVGVGVGGAAFLMSIHSSKTLNSAGSWGGGSFIPDKEQLCECKYLRKSDLDSFSSSYLYLERSEPMLIHSSP